MAAGAVWQTLCLIYEGDPRVRRYQVDPNVEMPVNEVMSILMTCQANLLANIPSKSARAEVVGRIPAQLMKAIEEAEKAQSPSGLWLPEQNFPLH